ncbi:N-acetyltransferase family 8 member 3-like [Colossoma macropomum]|uniref:N-acetyltransferase family 8 member 3-like n=1 Tax=Colossoma macropomum TaxID=42526 RepID=UPI00186518D4|nr:N-acetyltransferase family 8 member 3-like [Colossoma macropomum]
MHIVIRKFQPSDREAVTAIFRDGIQEHIIPSLTHAISQPLHITVTLCFFTVGYTLGGGSVVLALLAGGLWIGLLYYCCYELYAGFVRLKLNTDMRDIAGFYLSSPDNYFWVAEAEVNGRPHIMGMVAVVAKELPDSGQKYGELFRMTVSSTSRRTGLGSRLVQTVIDFCKERGFSKIMLETSSTQTAAVALYSKMGFTLVQTHEQAEAPWWVLRLVRVTVLRMEKILQPCEGM